MSVHGEFERYLKETLSALRETDRPDFLGWAEEAEARASNSDEPLEERARCVLDGPLGRNEDWDAPSPLADAVEGLLAISRIILGR